MVVNACAYIVKINFTIVLKALHVLYIPTLKIFKGFSFEIISLNLSVDFLNVFLLRLYLS